MPVYAESGYFGAGSFRIHEHLFENCFIQKKRIEKELLILNKRKEAELRLWKEEKKSWQGLRELVHSLRAHFASIHTYLEMQNIDGLKIIPGICF